MTNQTTNNNGSLDEEKDVQDAEFVETTDEKVDNQTAANNSRVGEEPNNPIQDAAPVEGSDAKQAEEELEKGFLEDLSDFFLKMILGIFIFAFKKVPLALFSVFTDFTTFKRVFSNFRKLFMLAFYFLIWFAMVFLGFITFWTDKFLTFWGYVIGFVLGIINVTVHWIWINIGWIWMCIAIFGSFYGLLTVTLKRKKERKQKRNS